MLTPCGSATVRGFLRMMKTESGGMFQTDQKILQNIIERKTEKLDVGV
jgi:hypothetical protein